MLTSHSFLRLIIVVAVLYWQRLQLVFSSAADDLNISNTMSASTTTDYFNHRRYLRNNNNSSSSSSSTLDPDDITATHSTTDLEVRSKQRHHNLHSSNSFYNITDDSHMRYESRNHTHSTGMGMDMGNNNSSDSLHIRGEASGDVPDGYYTDTPLNFLRRYGPQYGYYNMFFNYSSNITIDGKFHESNSNLVSFNYTTRDYGQEINLYRLQRNEAEVIYYNYSNLVSISKHVHLYNDRFRYGLEQNDRFLDVFFQNNPWQADGPLSSIHFVGFNVNLQERYKTLYCEFLHPFHHWVTATMNEHGIYYDPLLRPTGETKVFCRIPTYYSLLLAKLKESTRNNSRDNNSSSSSSSSSSNSASSLNMLTFHFHGKTLNDHKHLLLSNITLYEPHPLDQMAYNVSLSFMVDDLEDKLMLEWIIYNILLGVDHFYLYDNSKKHRPNFAESQLKPFFDANIITYIFYPAISEVFWNQIQRVSFNMYLGKYGHLTKWWGMYDIDEFLLPSKTFIAHHHHLVTNETGMVKVFLQSIWESSPAVDKVPAIMLDTVEMGCDFANNSYKDTNSQDHPRLAVSTHCIRMGRHFNEMMESHGKMFVRTALVDWLISPHRHYDYYTIWGTIHDEGSFRHFDNFKYTLYGRHDVDGDVVGWAKHQSISNELRNFTLHLLESRVGVKSVS